MRFGLLVGLVLVLLPQASQADTPARPEPYVVSNDAAFFKMLPEKWDWDVSKHVPLKDAYGVAYMLQDDGSFKELWRTEGWYAFATHISRDGQFLVREGDWAVGSGPDTAHLAVAFYKDGKLLKRYSTADLIKNKDSVDRSVSHYMWRSYEGGYPYLRYDNRFYLRTIEDVFFIFDATTGELIERTTKKPE